MNYDATFNKIIWIFDNDTILRKLFEISSKGNSDQNFRRKEMLLRKIMQKNFKPQLEIDCPCMKNLFVIYASVFFIIMNKNVIFLLT